jgi:hypothetical protein
MTEEPQLDFLQGKTFLPSLNRLYRLCGPLGLVFGAYRRILYLELKRPERETNHLLPLGAGVRMRGVCLPSPAYLRGGRLVAGTRTSLLRYQHFIWQILVATYSQFVYCINVVHSPSCPYARQSCGGKWQAIVVS